MALDTNVKEFKYSVWTKIICIVLAVFTFSTSTAMIVRTVTSVLFTEIGGGNFSQWTDNYQFKNYFMNDVNSLIELSYREEADNVLQAVLSNEKEDFVERAYIEYLGRKEQYETLKEEYNELPEDNDVFDPEITIYTGEIKLNEHYSRNYDYTYNFYELKKIDNNNGTDRLKEYIGEKYDAYISKQSANSGYVDYWLDNRADYSRNSLMYFTKYGEIVNSNIDYAENDREFNEQSYNDESDVYFILRNGEVEYKGITEEFASSIYKNYIKNNQYAAESEVYIYICIPSDGDKLITRPRYWNDVYINLYNFSKTAFEYRHKLTESVIIESILMVIAFVSGIYALTIAGKRKDGTVKLAFIDKLPFSLHFILSGALICGAGAIFLSITENFFATEFSVLFIILSGLAAFTGWVLLFEFCSSIARYIHSGGKAKDNFILNKLYRLTVKLLKNVKPLLAYKPGTLNARAIVLTILYFVVNLLVMGIAYLCAYDAIPFSILILAADAIANVFIIIKVIKYLKNLDTIITAFSNHQEPDVNIDTLPSSLKVLAESMKYTNEELQNAVNKAIKDERLRSELITNVSHDLKTPLTSIITYVDLLSKCDISDEKAKEYIAVLDDKGAKLKRLIEDLIEASKVTSGNVTVNLTSINLSELCMQSTVDAQADFEKAGLNLIVRDCEQPPIVTGDGAKTYRVVENLLSNARKYSALSSRVYVNVYSENGWGVFEIKNISAQPLDISPDELTERFVRGDKSRNQEGNGLGLSIAKELCRLQNGRLELTIDGDLFKARVKLPLA